ncbi:MAG: serine O-acetyltransferase [Actinobacteria bacterium]|nr:serine O-acetyltransferase [Actinomycetota bacterium]
MEISRGEAEGDPFQVWRDLAGRASLAVRNLVEAVSRQGEPEGLLGDVKALFSEGGTLRGAADLRQAIRVLLVKPGVQALLFYRLYRRLYLRGLRLLPEFLSRLNYLLTGAEIDPGADIGPGCRIWHTAGVTIGRGVKIGRDVWILHNVTLGGRGASPFDPGEEGYPRIGDGAILYTGVTVLGNVEIGPGAVIGAHSLVLDDVPAGSLAYGIPARVVRRPGRH